MIKVIKKGDLKPVVLNFNKQHIVLFPESEEHNESIKIGKEYFDISYSADYGTIDIYEAKDDKSSFGTGKLIKSIKLK
jgi:hypothetical protein